MTTQGPNHDEDHQALVVLLKALKFGDDDVASRVLTFKPELRQARYGRSAVTPLIGALILNPDCREALFRQLIQSPCSVNAQNDQGWAALHLIARHNRTELLSILFEQNGVNLNLKTVKGETPLAIAAGYGHHTIVTMLLEKGADDSLVDSPENDERLPIHLACLSGSFACVQALLKKDHRLLSACDAKGRTPAHYLAQSNSTNQTDKEAIAALFSAQQLAKECNDDVTPVEMARSFKHDDLVKVMERRQMLSLYQCCLNAIGKRYDRGSIQAISSILPEEVAEKLNKKKARMMGVS